MTFTTTEKMKCALDNNKNCHITITIVRLNSCWQIRGFTRNCFKQPLDDPKNKFNPHINSLFYTCKCDDILKSWNNFKKMYFIFVTPLLVFSLSIKN